MGAPGRIVVAGQWWDEIAFVDAVQRGDVRACELLVMQVRLDRAAGAEYSMGLHLVALAFRSKIMGFLKKRWFERDEETAEEVWNDTLFRVYEGIDGYDPAGSAFRTWVFNLARWVALDIVRERRRDALSGRAVALAAQEFAAEMPMPLDGQEVGSLRAALARLEEAERRLLVLRFVYDFKNVEIAREHLSDLPEEHVRVYISRALARLCGFFAEEERARLASADDGSLRSKLLMDFASAALSSEFGVPEEAS